MTEVRNPYGGRGGSDPTDDLPDPVQVDSLQLIALHLCCKNDGNGNPRRCYLLLDAATGYTIAVVDEGYSGRQAVEEAGFHPVAWHGSTAHERVTFEGPTLDVPPAERQHLLRHSPNTRAEAQAIADAEAGH
jgi:hypothetical protein